MGASCHAHFELIRPFGAITGALNKSQITTCFRLGSRSAFRFGLASSNRNVGADQIHAAYRPQVPADGQITAHSTPRKFFGCTLPIMVLQAYSTCLADFHTDSTDLQCIGRSLSACFSLVYHRALGCGNRCAAAAGMVRPRRATRRC